MRTPAHEVQPPAEWADLPPRRWGFVGAGRIAASLADAMAVVPGEVVAVSARDPDRVAAFAATHGIPRAHTDLDALLADDVDAIYVATPHSHHHQPVLAALAAGIPVLCEKPLTHSLADTRACTDAARDHGVFLLEAMWTRFLPATATAEAWIAAGDIGTPVRVEARMGFAAPPDPEGRLFSPALAGGAVLDIGVYPLSLTRWAFPTATLRSIDVDWQPAMTGVDGQVDLVMRFDGGEVADLTASIVADQDGTARIIGSEGTIEIPRFHKAEQVRLVRDGEVVRTAEHPHPVNGLEHQVAAMTAALAEGALEHPRMPWADTLAVAAWSQEVRDRTGVRYPFEAPPGPVPGADGAADTSGPPTSRP